MGEVKLAEVIGEVGGEVAGVADLLEFGIHTAREGGDAGLGEAQGGVGGGSSEAERLGAFLSGGDGLGVTAESKIFKKGAGV